MSQQQRASLDNAAAWHEAAVNQIEYLQAYCETVIGNIQSFNEVKLDNAARSHWLDYFLSKLDTGLKRQSRAFGSVPYVWSIEQKSTYKAQFEEFCTLHQQLNQHVLNLQKRNIWEETILAPPKNYASVIQT